MAERACGEHRTASGLHWHYITRPKNSGATWTSNINVEARPLVVIDPEDRQQVERLSDAYDGLSTDSMQAALRSLIAPLKPEEPTGLGAVVLDAEDHQWVRSASEFGGTYRNATWYSQAIGGWRCYDDIDVVEVLSEGV